LFNDLAVIKANGHDRVKVCSFSFSNS